MKHPEDFKEFIALLNVHDVEYLIVGGYAVSYHSKPKFTNDMDIWIKSDIDNAKKVVDVIREFGFNDLDIHVEDFLEPDVIVQLGHAPMRIDILTSISGVDFNQAFQNRVEDRYFDEPAFIISMDDLQINKKESGRKKDLDDIQWIEKYKR